MAAGAHPTIAVDLRALVPEATGIGVYTRSLLAALARRGNARYLGLSHRPLREAELLAGAGVTLEQQPSPLGVLWQQWQLPRRLRQGDLDLFWSPLGILPWRCPVPSVVTVHDLTVLLLPETHGLKVRLSQLPFLQRTLEHAERVVAISEATAADLRFHFPQCAERVRVVHNGIDPEFQPAGEAAVAATRAALGCREGYVLYAGTLEPRKNLGLLLTAWEALYREAPEDLPPLLLAGPYGWRSRDLLARAERLAPAGVRLLGRLDRPRLVEVMQSASIFVYPSLYEGFGLPPAEAMACGVPVVAADSSSLPEVVDDAGLLVPPEDAGALAGALRHLLAEPELAAELGRRGRERSRRFTWAAAAAGMEAVFAEALAR